MTEIHDVLQERNTSHGDFRTQFDCAQQLKGVLKTFNLFALDNVYREALEMILMKVSRIVTGKPDFEDHWRDIAGYATLIADMLQKPVEGDIADVMYGLKPTPTPLLAKLQELHDRQAYVPGYSSSPPYGAVVETNIDGEKLYPPCDV